VSPEGTQELSRSVITTGNAVSILSRPEGAPMRLPHGWSGAAAEARRVVMQMRVVFSMQSANP
jgi:hypothetical protein